MKSHDERKTNVKENASNGRETMSELSRNEDGTKRDQREDRRTRKSKCKILVIIKRCLIVDNYCMVGKVVIYLQKHKIVMLLVAGEKISKKF